jgi:hypothetical protein
MLLAITEWWIWTLTLVNGPLSLIHSRTYHQQKEGRAFKEASSIEARDSQSITFSWAKSG